MKIGIVGIPGGWSTEKLADCVQERTGYRLVVELDAVRLSLHEGKALFRGVDLCSLDALIVKKLGEGQSPGLLDRVEVLRFIESRGVTVLSRPEAMIRMLDRLSCTVTLASNAIPMPETQVTEDVEHAHAIVKGFGEAVFKPLFSTKARGMWVASAADPGLMHKIRAFYQDNRMMYIQRKIHIPGRDLGVLFLDGKYLGTYARVAAPGVWNTTTQSGGRYEKHEPKPEVLDLATRAQGLFGLSLTSVDVVETEQGPQVFEVSAFGGFRGLASAQRVDVARLYVDHVIERVQERRAR